MTPAQQPQELNSPAIATEFKQSKRGMEHIMHKLHTFITLTLLSLSGLSHAYGTTPQSISFGALPNKTLGAAPVILTASASSGLAVSLSSATPAVCTTGGLHGSTLTLTGAGTCTINANQAGDATYAAANQISRIFIVNPTPSAAARLAVGSAHTCIINNGGAIQCWGLNGNGQLGDGTLTTRSNAQIITQLGIDNQAIVTGAGHSCALNTAGGVQCWGTNGNGQLGDGTTTDRSAPVAVTGLTNGITALSAGAYHTCALTNSGGIKCWGSNYNSQLGDGTTTDRSTPVDVSGLTSGISAISAGSSHSCALTTGGGIKCWGPNHNGQLGDGTTTARLAPTDVSGLTSGISAISAGGAHTCAVTTGGQAKCWGNNYNGQLGDNSTTNRLTATTVTGLSSGIATIRAGNGYSCALTTGGGIKCWGSNTNGQLGDNSTTARLTPVDVNGLTAGVAAIDAGMSSYNSCIQLTGGGNKCWGRNDKGQLGDGSTTDRLTPVSVLAAPQTINFTAPELYKAVTDPAFTLNASASSGLAVAFTSATPSICTINSNTVSLIGAGTCTLNANQAGDPNTSVAAQNSQSFTVSAAMTNQSISFAALSSKAMTAAPFSLTATASSSLTVSYGSATPAVCTVTGGTVTLIALGTCTIYANQSGNPSYRAAAQVSQSFSVLQGQSITFSPIPAQQLGAAPFTVSATATSGLAVSLSSATTAICTATGTNGSTVTLLSSGTCTLNANQAGDASYAAAAQISQSFIVEDDDDGSIVLMIIAALKPSCTITSNVSYPTASSGRITLISTCTKAPQSYTWSGPNNFQQATTGNSVTFDIPNAPGVYTFKVTAKNSNISSDEKTIVVRVKPAPQDFNGDGKSDLAWEQVDGSSAIWLMNGTAMSTGDGIIGANSGWSIKHTADFNGDGKADLLWQHTNGSSHIWLMNGLSLFGDGALMGPGSGWSAKHIGDFNGDGKSDIIWQHTDGSAAIWLMDGTAASAGSGIMSANSSWRVKHIGDFNGDGRSDILWEHTDGSSHIWLMNGLSLFGDGGLMGAGSGWRVKHIADLNGDGKADIIWEHADGSSYAWLMDGLTRQSHDGLPVSSGWRVKHTGDLNGDGKADLIWQHTNGSSYAWLMDGLTRQSHDGLPVSSGWTIKHTGDLNGDGKADLVWQHTNGSSYVWLMNGLAQLSAAELLSPNTGWEPFTGVEKLYTYVGVSEEFSCGLTGVGGVKCWGLNINGALGDGTQKSHFIPLPVSGLSNGVQSLSVGVEHNCVVLSVGGAVQCWGANVFGSLGNKTNSTDQTTPGPVWLDASTTLTGVKSVHAAHTYSCALMSTGTVKCWGKNNLGIFGNTNYNNIYNTATDIAGLSGVKALSTSTGHICALMDSGGIKCWGLNFDGALGDGTTTHRTSPVDVVGLGASPNIKAIAAGASLTCALTNAGGVKCWGNNNYGQLGDGTTTNRLLPTDVVGLTSGVIGIAAGAYNACAILQTGNIKCWGKNDEGQLGDGTTTNRSSPVLVTGISNVVQIAPGFQHTCATTLSGDIKCWGLNQTGQLGNGTTTNSSTPSTTTNTNSSGIYLSLSNSTAQAGQTVYLYVAVVGNNPTGTVTFKSNGVDIAGCTAKSLVAGTASCTTSFATGGNKSITVSYSGDAGNPAITSAASILNMGYTVTPAIIAGAGNGTVSPNTAQTVTQGATTSFTITANAGYTVNMGGGAGSCIGTLAGSAPNFTYTTNPIAADCAVRISFVLNADLAIITKAVSAQPGGVVYLSIGVQTPGASYTAASFAVSDGSIGTSTPSTPLAWVPGAAGTYAITATVTLSGGGTTTTSTNMVIAPTPAANSNAAPISTATVEVGSTAGSFAVTDSGAASYTIPIQVVPGAGGMQPNLALNYSSQGGNGPLGQGWGMSGLSTISYCTKTHAQDGYKEGVNYNYTLTDRPYCLDGQRLIPIGTKIENRTINSCGASTRSFLITEYRTEVDGYSRIVSYTNNNATQSDDCMGGPIYWEVYAKSGQVMGYGSRYMIVTHGWMLGYTNVASLWALDQVTDRLGNHMYIDYEGSPVQAPDSSIHNSVNLRANPIEIGGNYGPTAGPLGPIQANPEGIYTAGSVPAVEYWPTQIVYTINPNTAAVSGAMGKAQAVRFEHNDRLADWQGCMDCSAAYDGGTGQRILSKALNVIRTYSEGTYNVAAGSFTGGTLARRYNLNYVSSPATKRMRLSNVQECSGDNVCLPATQFTWQGAALTASKMNLNQVNGIFETNKPRVIDIDGDGISDVAGLVGDTGQTRLRTMLSTRNWNGAGTEFVLGNVNYYDVQQAGWDVGDFNGDGMVDVVARTSVAGGSGNWDVFFAQKDAGGNISFNRVSTTLAGNVMPGTDINNNPNFRADLNGDGRIDLIFYNGAAGGYDNWLVYLGAKTVSGGPAMFGPIYLKTSLVIYNDDAKQRVTMADITGDGKADFVLRPYTSNFHNRNWVTCKSNLPAIEDMVVNQVYDLPCSPTTSYVQATQGAVTNSAVVDINGDGLADLVGPNMSYLDNSTCGSQAGTRCWDICLSTGNGAFACTVQAGPATTIWDNNWILTNPKDAAMQMVGETVFGDFNGDGRMDYAAKYHALAGSQPSEDYPSKWTVCLARGGSIPTYPKYLNQSNGATKFDCTLIQGDSNWPHTTPHGDNRLYNVIGEDIWAGDFDGTGRTSILRRFGSVADVTVMNTPMADLMTGIATGLGATTGINYAPLTDSSVYTKGTGSVYPQLDIQSPMYVVKSTQASTGLGNGSTYNTGYAYEKLVGVIDATGTSYDKGAGHGLLGFGKRTITDTNNPAGALKTVIEYSQAWPNSGRPLSVSKYADPGNTGTFKKLNETLNTYTVRTVGRPNNHVTYEPFLTGSVDTSWELTGYSGDTTKLFTTSTNIPLANIDSYGNPGLVTVSTGDGSSSYSKTTTNVYDNDTNYWVLGRLTSASVSSVAPGTPTLTRSSAFTYYCMGSQTCPSANKRGLLATETIEPNHADLNQQLSTSYTYDNFGNKLDTIVGFYENGVSKSRSTSTYWSGDGRFAQTQINNSLGQTQSATYDGRWGAVSTATAIDGNKTNYHYDGLGRKVGEQALDAEGHLLAQTAWSYAAAAGVEKYAITTKRHDGATSTSYFDSLQRQVRSTANTFSGYHATSTAEYDALGRKIKTTQPVAGNGSAGSDAQAQIKTSSTSISYDLLNRPILDTVRNADGSTFTSTSISYGRQVISHPTHGSLVVATVSSTHANNSGAQTTKKYTNSQGQSMQTVDAHNKNTVFSYDALGNLVKVKGPTGIEETMTYDLRGRKLSMNNPDSSAWSYTYNGAGELLSQTDAKGQTINMSYDLGGRMASRTEGGVTTTWYYDDDNPNCRSTFTPRKHYIGKVCKQVSGQGGTTASNTGSTKTIQYDPQGRAFQTTTRIAGVDYNSYSLYDADGHPKWTGYPANDKTGNVWVQNNYNAYGYQTEVIDPVTNTQHWQATGRYADGRAFSSTVGGVIVQKGYDTQGRINYIVANGGTLQGSEFIFDQIGNLISRADAVTNYRETFTYDALNRVIGSSQNNNTNSGTYVTKSFGYDDAGNLTSKAGIALTYVGGSHRLNTVNGGNAYIYDANGNVTTAYSTDGIARTMAYTAFNLPTSITKGSNVLSYDYDGDHSRIKEISTIGANSTTTIYVGSQFFEATTRQDGSKEWRYYIGSPDGVVGVIKVDGAGAGTTSRKYWLKDHLDSVFAEMDAGGANIQYLSFDAWGKRRLSSGVDGDPANLGSLSTQRGYTQHEMLDEVGLVHMNGRIYDPATGRFLQADPIIQAPYDSQSYNRYSYVMNNPLSATDPTGYYSWWGDHQGEVRTVAAIVVSYYVGKWAGDLIMQYGTVTATSNATFVGGISSGGASATYVTASTVSTAGAVSGAAAGFASGGIMGGNLQSAVYGAVRGGLAGYLSDGASLQNPIDQVKKLGSEVAQGNFQYVGETALRYAISVKIDRESDRLAARLGVRPEVLDIGLMTLSMVGNNVTKTRFKGGDGAFKSTKGVGFEGVFNRGIAGIPFDTVDVLLGYKGLPTASLHDFSVSNFRGGPVSGHSLGTMDVNYAVGHGLASNGYMRSLPFGNVAHENISVGLGTADFVNGGFLGRVFNWGARLCATGGSHLNTTYASVGC